MIQAEKGMGPDIVDRLRTLTLPEARILFADEVTGPTDVMALLEAASLDQLGRAVSGSVRGIEGIRRTATCLAIEP
jgi:DNA-binding Lrp family transcriptional regulator